ncbi:(2Fe-2S) ferredoxin domain-containing protein [Streptomyces scabiei]|uniref:(2Fe-2S) ferredoxin domain-containing protein n=1 Tax=Streptomyces scabiei TaxID=1930 RepID=UPI0029B883B2|nr:(2Fe-2S) ferredoxin domain-containing protein [Streptomyces scabiei]MDX3114106.1 (2Fe-2S) ferredoxin domain-containing protein [Streptomyces scabiei]
MGDRQTGRRAERVALPSQRTVGGRAAIGAAARRPCTLVVCRGCCCGVARKHPGFDHAWQLERLRAAAAASGGGFQVRTTDCLGPCDQANVVVVQPSADGRRAGGRATWVGFAMDDDCTQEILAWATAGGPGVAAPPATLELQFISPPREGRVRRR